MRDVVTLPRHAVPRLLSAIVAQGVEGSRDPRVLIVTGEAVRAVEAGLGRPGTPLEQAAEAYTRALAAFRFAEDAYGDETVQAPGFTLQRGAGDCDDATALVVALARALGVRVRVVLVSRDVGDGRLEATHVYAELEGPAGWLPADLGGYLGLGEPVRVAPGAVRHVVDVDAPEAGRGVGFLDALLGGVFGLVSAGENRRAAERTAEAAERAAATQAAATRAAAESERRAVAEQAAAALDVARLQAMTRAAELRASGQNLAAVLSTARGLLRPTLLVLALVAASRAVGPALANLTRPAARPRASAPPAHPAPSPTRAARRTAPARPGARRRAA